MGSWRDHPDLTSTLRVAQETGRLRLDSPSRTALLQTSMAHGQPSTINIPSPAGTPSAAAAAAAQTEEKTSEETAGGGGTGSGFFGCNICFEMAVDPVLTTCGHLFCWPCIYQWLNGGGHHPRKCPVCMGDVVTDNVIPIYGRGPETPSRTADDQTDALRGVLPPNNIPPRPSAHRVITPERRPGRRSSSSSNPGSSSARHRPGGGTGEAASEHYRARRDSSGILSPMVDFVGVTTGPHPAYAGIPLEGQAYFPQPLEPGIYFAPITSIHPQQYFSLAQGGAGISAGGVDHRNIPRPAPPLPPHLMQCFLEEPSRNLYLGQVRETPLVMLGMEDSLRDSLAEFLISSLEDDPPLPPPPSPIPPPRGTVNGGGEERGTSRLSVGSPLFPAFPLQPDLGLFASSSSTTSTPGSATDHHGNTSTAPPPPSVGDLCFPPPPEKRRRF